METWERIKTFLQYKRMNATTFSQAVGIGNNVTINKIINHQRNPYDSTLNKILDAFPELNPDWLKKGEGKMLLYDALGMSASNAVTEPSGEFKKTYRSSAIVSPNNYRIVIKLVEPRDFPDYLASYDDPDFVYNLPEIETFVKEIQTTTYRAFRVKGDSMDGRGKRSIYDEDVVVGRAIDRSEWKSNLHIHNYLEWIIVYRGGILVKHISQHDAAKGTITCVSYNEDKLMYPDFTLKLDDVYELYNVVKVMSDR